MMVSRYTIYRNILLSPKKKKLVRTCYKSYRESLRRSRLIRFSRLTYFYESVSIRWRVFGRYLYTRVFDMVSRLAFTPGETAFVVFIRL